LSTTKATLLLEAITFTDYGFVKVVLCALKPVTKFFKFTGELTRAINLKVSKRLFEAKKMNPNSCVRRDKLSPASKLRVLLKDIFPKHSSVKLLTNVTRQMRISRN